MHPLFEKRMLKRWVIPAVAVVTVGGVLLSRAQQPGAGTPPPQSRPLLEQLDRESQSLYEEVRQQMVRVEMPVPTDLMNLLARDNPAMKWGRQLDEPVRQELQRKTLSGQTATISAEVAAPGGAEAGGAGGAGTTQPATQPTSGPVAARAGDPTTQKFRLVGIPTGQQDAQGRQTLTWVLRPADEKPATTQYTLEARAKVNTSGLILDEDGHLVVPLFLDKEAAEQGPIVVYGAGGSSCAARFVASDSKMNLTVLKMEKMIGRPARVDEKRPPLGSMVMIVTPNQSTARMAVWTGGVQEFGVVCGLDGKIDGFVRHGQFLNAPLWRPVVRQLIETGVVRRASLGVWVQEIPAGVRPAVPGLGGRSAIQVGPVAPGGAADRGGIKTGDYILSLGKKPVDDVPSFAAAIADLDGKTELEILRDGQVRKVVVELKQE
jgi:S1-C subfamily serine protease